mgnify:FL=1
MSRIWRNMEELPAPFIDRIFCEPDVNEVAVERGHWLFYVRVTPRGTMLVGEPGSGDLVYELVRVFLLIVFAYPLSWVLEKQKQKVAVIRWDNRKASGRKIPFRTMIDPKEPPAPLIEQLLARIESGEFDGES